MSHGRSGVNVSIVSGIEGEDREKDYLKGNRRNQKGGRV